MSKPQRAFYRCINVFGIRYLVFLYECWSWRLHGAATVIAMTNWMYDTSLKLRSWWRRFRSNVRLRFHYKIHCSLATSIEDPRCTSFSWLGESTSDWTKQEVSLLSNCGWKITIARLGTRTAIFMRSLRRENLIAFGILEVNGPRSEPSITWWC